MPQVDCGGGRYDGPHSHLASVTIVLWRSSSCLPLVAFCAYCGIPSPDGARRRNETTSHMGAGAGTL